MPRMLAKIRSSAASLGRPRSTMRIGGIRTPSWKISVAPPDRLPGLMPPTSPQCARTTGKTKSSSAPPAPGAKSGDDHRHVVQVRAAGVGVVVQEDVARVDVVAELLAHRAHRPADGHDVQRVVLALGHRHDLGLAVHEDAGEVLALVEDRRVRGAHERDAHLAHDRDEGLAQDLERDGVDHAAASRSSRSGCRGRRPRPPSRAASPWSRRTPPRWRARRGARARAAARAPIPGSRRARRRTRSGAARRARRRARRWRSGSGPPRAWPRGRTRSAAH